VCFAYDARPPELPPEVGMAPLAGGAAAELAELCSADGTWFSAALARPAEASDVGVVILPDVRGLYRFYVELAERFADAGHAAIAIDYFGRTAGTGQRDEDFDYWPHVMETRVPTVQADVAAAISALRDQTGVTRVATVGLCFGGTHSFLAAAQPDLGLDRVVGFYGGLESSGRGLPRPADAAGQMVCPVLGLFGGADERILPEHVERFEQALGAAGVDHEVVTYPGAPHSFFDRSQHDYADACADAWRRALAFLA
jgi:carboxymethylenebutenolidase